MAKDPRLARQHAELERVRLLSNLFDPDPEAPGKIAASARELPLPPGLRSRSAAAVAAIQEANRECLSRRKHWCYRIAGDAVVRPNFYLPEFDLYIEYFGMDTPEYLRNMEKKRRLYQRAGKRLVSVSYKDDDRLLEVLREKLSRYFRLERAEPPLPGLPN